MKKLFAVVMGVLLMALSAIAQAGDPYPQQSIRLLVPAEPGGAADFIARLISPVLSASLGQAVVVENKSGASGTIAGNLVAKSKPNGYTLLMAQNTSIVIAPHLYKQLPYDTLKDLAPVSLVISVPNILVVNPNVPAKTVSEFIALAKAKPGSFSYGSAGIGSPSHIAGEMFDKDAGVQMLHVPYQGSAPAVTALLGNQIPAMFAPITAVLPLVRANQLRALGVTTAGRLPSLPNIPTIAESGVPGFDINSWFGLFAAANTPPEIIARLNRAVAEALKDPRVSAAIAKMASAPVGNSSAAFTALVRTEDQRYADLLKKIGPQLQ
ncbi:tripartite tricarboxylate transporter substrate binding protein [Paraburkholderia sp. RL18-103-BIB-C]|jgi:tripartite-type tricarboxylate transporter receptor subunit TctC|uniref:Bug family tripartite tricarboxylate transporter substrate binding protein n=1 Tax=Paraburkholderia sp. RL18-103-BIB-C TaxID=3031637 RepID=UPI0038B9F068